MPLALTAEWLLNTPSTLTRTLPKHYSHRVLSEKGGAILVAMNARTLNAQVEVEERDEAIIRRVSGVGETLRGNQAIVPTHAARLAESFQWETERVISPRGASLTLNTSDPEQLQRFRALGFFEIWPLDHTIKCIIYKWHAARAKPFEIRTGSNLLTGCRKSI